MLLQEVIDTIIKPNLGMILEQLRKGTKITEIRKELKISNAVWKMCLANCPELVEVIETWKGPNSDYHCKVEPFFEQINEWMCSGITERGIAKKLGIESILFKTFIKIYPEFGQFMIQCRNDADEEVESAVFKSATGFQVEEKKESIEEGEILYDTTTGEPIWLKDSSGNYRLNKEGKRIAKRKPGKVKLEKVTKQVIPSVAAQTFYLTNKKKKHWSVKSEVDHKLSPQEIAKDIQDTLRQMEETVPSVPKLTPFEQAQSLIKDIKPEELEKLKKIVDAMSQ